MGRHYLFVAPDTAQRVFSRIAAVLSNTDDRTFHSLLLFSAELRDSPWSVAAEVEALARATSPEVGYDVVGYSGGGAMSLAFASVYPARIRTLCLIEPPWIGNDIWSESERRFVADFDRLAALDDAACVEGFTQLFAPGKVDEFGVNGDEIARWASALRTVWQGYRETALDRAALARLKAPTLLPVGRRSASRMLDQAKYLADHVFPAAEIAIIPDCDHFDIFKSGAFAIAESLTRLAATP